MKFPKTHTTKKVYTGGYYVDREVERSPAEIQEIRRDFENESLVYRALDPSCEAEYLVKQLRFSSQGLRQEQNTGMLHTDQYYLAMEFSQNGALLDLVMALHSQEGGINLNMVRFWFRRILMGVHFMHSRGFVHLDIKHDNILLDQANVPKLADFGFT